MKTFLIALFMIGGSAFAQKPLPPHRVLVRITSATWCIYCKILENNLKKEGYLKAPTKQYPYLLKGTMPIEVAGMPLIAVVEQIESDAKGASDCKVLKPPLDMRGIYSLPFIRVFLDGNEIYSGSRHEMGGDDKFATYDDAEGIKTRIISLLKNYILENPKKNPPEIDSGRAVKTQTNL